VRSTGRQERWAALLTALFLSAAQAQVGERVRVCAGCHGPDGNSVTPGIPSIAAQPKVFLETQLVLTREGLRATEIAQKRLIRGMSDREIIGVAAHFAQQPAHPAPGEVDQALFNRGRQVAGKLHCGSCHLPDFRGREQIDVVVVRAAPPAAG